MLRWRVVCRSGVGPFHRLLVAMPPRRSRDSSVQRRSKRHASSTAAQSKPGIELLVTEGDPIAREVVGSKEVREPTTGLTEETLEEAIIHLRQNDPKLIPLIDEFGSPKGLLPKSGSCFAALARSITGQQLGTQAAAAICKRTLEVCACPDALTVDALLSVDVTLLRGCGLSQRKIEYLRGLAEMFQDGTFTDELIKGMDDETLATELLKVRGLGPWSVNMFAMFHLGHPDILAVGDLGVRKGMQHLYGLKELPTPETMEKVAGVWTPWRSVGTYFMWHAASQAPRSPQKRRSKPATSSRKGKTVKDTSDD